jgi:hypothetical protein
MPDNFWLLFLANLPVVSALLWALHRKWIVMGVTFQREMDDKDKTHQREIDDKNKDLEFREQLRQEVLADKKVLEETNRDMATAINDLRSIVAQSIDLTESLVNENIQQKAVSYAKRA